MSPGLQNLLLFFAVLPPALRIGRLVRRTENLNNGDLTSLSIDNFQARFVHFSIQQSHLDGLCLSRAWCFSALGLQDLSEKHLAAGMPHVTVEHGSTDNPVYQVGGKSFVYFRTPRPDAFNPDTGERYTDVIIFWVESEAEKEALVQDPSTPFFTTPHFNHHPSVLLRQCRVGELSYDELAEVVQDAWLAQASQRRRDRWLAENGPA